MRALDWLLLLFYTEGSWRAIWTKELASLALTSFNNVHYTLRDLVHGNTLCAGCVGRAAEVGIAEITKSRA